MSPYKPQHAVPCAHCREPLHGDRQCAGCQRAVCQRCASEPDSCRRPRARVARLGRGARLRAVDPDGEVALVSSWTGKLRRWDLEARRYLGDVDAGRWLGDSTRFAGMLRDGSLVDRRGSLTATGAWVCRCGAHPVIVSGERVEVRGAGVDVRPLPRTEISRAAFDCESQLLAVASHDQLVVFRWRGGSLARIGSARTEGEPVSWLAVAGDRVAGLTARGRRGRLRGYRCASAVFYPLPFYEWIGGERSELRFRPIDAPPGEPAGALDDEVGVARDQYIEVEPARASMSSDGRLIAVALEDGVAAVHDLERGRVSLFGDHTDGLCYVGIAAGGRLLITGDNDNRVIVRERDGDGFARWLVR